MNRARRRRLLGPRSEAVLSSQVASLAGHDPRPAGRGLMRSVEVVCSGPVFAGRLCCRLRPWASGQAGLHDSKALFGPPSRTPGSLITALAQAWGPGPASSSEIDPPRASLGPPKAAHCLRALGNRLPRRPVLVLVVAFLPLRPWFWPAGHLVHG